MKNTELTAVGYHNITNSVPSFQSSVIIFYKYLTNLVNLTLCFMHNSKILHLRIFCQYVQKLSIFHEQ